MQPVPSMDTGAANMKKKKPGLKRKWLFLLLLVPVLLFLWLHLLKPADERAAQLVIALPGLDKTAHRIDIEKSDTFTLTYIHSVSGRPVIGTFVVTGENKLRPYSTAFDSFGPGLPETDGCGVYKTSDGWFFIYHDEEPRESLRLFVSPLTGDLLTVHGQEYDLTVFDDNPVLVEIFVASP